SHPAITGHARQDGDRSWTLTGVTYSTSSRTSNRRTTHSVRPRVAAHLGTTERPQPRGAATERNEQSAAESDVGLVSRTGLGWASTSSCGNCRWCGNRWRWAGVAAAAPNL